MQHFYVYSIGHKHVHQFFVAQSAGAIEYIDGISAGG